jgi:uncharacterized protein (TIGR02217 family)
MTYSVYPVLAGLGFDVIWTPEFSNEVQRSASGKETAIRFWSYPIRNYELTYDILRSAPTYAEQQTLLGFYNSVFARGNVFLFDDPDDDTVTGQNIGTGDGSTLAFQLQRTYGGFTEPIYAPHTVSKVYVDGVDQVGFWTNTDYTSTTPGIVTFSGGHAPAAGKAVTADFTYYFPCRFSDDMIKCHSINSCTKCGTPNASTFTRRNKVSHETGSFHSR